MADISKITLPNNTSYDIKDKSAIANITRNGTTFTATKRDGTTFTFDQQDSNSHNTAYIYAGASNGSANAATINGNTYLIIKDGSSVSSRIKLGTGKGISVTSDANGNITIQHTHTDITAGTVGTSSATSGSTLAVPYITYDAQGHITGTGTHTHTVSGFLTSSSSLDASKLTGSVPTSALPSYVDDVLEYTAKANFPTTGEEGKIYVDKTTNLTWRWGGSAYVEISPSLAIGSTASTAAKGNHTHTVTAAGTIAVQTAGTTTTVPNVTGVGSVPTTEDISADDITAWSAGTLPTLGTAIPADDITAWSAGTNPSLTITNQTVVTGTSVSNEVMSFTTATNGSASGWSAGTAPSLSYTAKSIPNVTGVGTLPSLTYTGRTIKSVKSVGSVPTLGTAITVKTGDAAYKFTGTSVTTSVPA